MLHLPPDKIRDWAYLSVCYRWSDIWESERIWTDNENRSGFEMYDRAYRGMLNNQCGSFFLKDLAQLSRALPGL